jgi:hypothetical protein
MRIYQNSKTKNKSKDTGINLHKDSIKNLQVPQIHFKQATNKEIKYTLFRLNSKTSIH